MTTPATELELTYSLLRFALDDRYREFDWSVWELATVAREMHRHGDRANFQHVRFGKQRVNKLHQLYLDHLKDTGVTP